MSIKLFDRRLIIVSGKGGVGKTGVSAALAFLAARSGRKVLVCELERDGRFARLFETTSEGADPIPTRIDNLNYLFVDTEAALEEYMAIYLRLKALYWPIVHSPIMKYFHRAAPGFKELLTIGKIWWEEQLIEGRPKKPKWDTIIVDAPATGHGMTFMGVSQATMNMVRVGPIHAQAQRMVEALQDAKRTALVVVTLPEEMPVRETIDLANKSRSELGINLGPIVVNAMPPTVFEDADVPAYDRLKNEAATRKLSPSAKALFGLAESGIARRKLALEHVSRLKEAMPNEQFVEIPFLHDWEWEEHTVQEMADRLGENIS